MVHSTLKHITLAFFATAVTLPCLASGSVAKESPAVNVHAAPPLPIPFPNLLIPKPYVKKLDSWRVEYEYVQTQKAKCVGTECGGLAAEKTSTYKGSVYLTSGEVSFVQKATDHAYLKEIKKAGKEKGHYVPFSSTEADCKEVKPYVEIEQGLVKEGLKLVFRRGVVDDVLHVDVVNVELKGLTEFSVGQHTLQMPELNEYKTNVSFAVLEGQKIRTMEFDTPNGKDVLKLNVVKEKTSVPSRPLK